MSVERRSIRTFLLEPVSPKHLDYALICFCYVTGLLDCSVFAEHLVFVGMQTGNTMLLCLASAGLPSGEPYSYAATLVSIGSFLLGACTTYWACAWAGKLRRITVTTNLFLQAVCITIPAALITARSIPAKTGILGNPDYIAGIPFLAFQAGAQICTSRVLGYNELPINVLTSTYADLVSDPRLLAKDNVKRNRRVLAVVGVAGGAFSAAWIDAKGPGIMLSLWIGAGVKYFVAIVAFLFMHPAEKKDLM